MERLLERIASPARSEAEEEERREAAELLHAMGTAEVLQRLDHPAIVPTTPSESRIGSPQQSPSAAATAAIGAIRSRIGEDRS